MIIGRMKYKYDWDGDWMRGRAMIAHGCVIEVRFEKGTGRDSQNSGST